MFSLMMNSTHFICGFVALDIPLKTTQITREEICHDLMDYCFPLAARDLLYTPYNYIIKYFLCSLSVL